MLRVTVESFDQMRDDTLDAVDAVSDGDAQPAVVSFRTVGELRKVLTDRRIELLRALMATEGAAESISELADAVNRDYRTVHDDVSLLTEHGLLFIIEDGRPRRLPDERVHLDVELVSGEGDEEPAVA